MIKIDQCIVQHDVHYITKGTMTHVAHRGSMEVGAQLEKE
jgi:hypothetical protein